jgi:integrase
MSRADACGYLREKGARRTPYRVTTRARGVPALCLEQTGLSDEPKGPLFRTIARGPGQLSKTALPQAHAYAMVRRRALGVGIDTKIGNHTFRATGITARLKNGGTLENAAAMSNHASTRTTRLYDRRRDDISLGEVERIRV